MRTPGAAAAVDSAAVEDFMAAARCGPVASAAVRAVMRDAATEAERATLAPAVMQVAAMGIAGPAITAAVIIAEWGGEQQPARRLSVQRRLGPTAITTA